MVDRRIDKDKTTDERAAKALKSLETRIENKQQSASLHDPVPPEAYEFELRDLQDAWRRTEQRLSDMSTSSKTRLSEFGATLTNAAREIGHLTEQMRQRVNDLSADGPPRSRYFVTRASGGRWQLKLEKATRATKEFESKSEAVKYSRRYVRGKQPSELVVCRADGTFQSVHRYA